MKLEYLWKKIINKADESRAKLFSRIIKLPNGLSLSIPPGHFYDIIVRNYKNYNQPLYNLAQLIYEENGAYEYIDIGANIGDTVLPISQFLSCAHLFEGNKEYLWWLERNCASIPTVARIIPQYINVRRASNEKVASIFVSDGTARIDFNGHISAGDGSIVDEDDFVELSTYIRMNVDFRKLKLIKIDTDGLDFRIIDDMLNEGLFEQVSPNLYFEFDPVISHMDAAEIVDIFRRLISHGYVVFSFFDNYGNLLVKIPHDIMPLILHQFIAYLFESDHCGGGFKYFDVHASPG